MVRGMADDAKPKAEDGPQEIPVKDWIAHPVSDHGDLDRPMPLYVEDLSPNDRAEFEAAVEEKKQREAAMEAQRLAQEQEAALAKQGEKPKP